MTSLNFQGAERAHNAHGLRRRELNFTRAEIAESEYLQIYPAMMRDAELVGEALFERPRALPALLLALEAVASGEVRSLRTAILAMRQLREEVASYIAPIAEKRADRIADDYWGDDE